MEEAKKASTWFESWFDSPYYHLLYSNRNEEEAAQFLERLMKHLSISTTKLVLDLACGSGRHSRVLCELGYVVDGADLSENSIREAKEKASGNQHFYVHDMRCPLPKKYDVILNLFTSFGYFDQLSDNEKVLKAVFDGLTENGLLIIDFLNSPVVIRTLLPRQEIKREEIVFRIGKTVSNNRIVKTITFDADGNSYFFQEKVQAIHLQDFKQLFQNTGFELIETFGSYTLEPYIEATSERLIMVCKKVENR